MDLEFNFVGLLLLFIAMAVYGFAVVASFAVLRTRVRRLREMGGRPPRSVARARFIVLRADSYLLALQLTKFLGAVVSGAVGSAIALQLLGIDETERMVPIMTTIAALLVGAFILSLATFVGVQFAKSWTFANPELMLCRLGWPILATGKLLYPLVGPLEYLVERALSGLGMSPPVERETAKSAEEITEMVELGAEAGEIEQDERQMIESVFRFSDTVVREVMTPRADIVHLSIDSTLEEVRSTFVVEGVSRLLVVGDTLDDVRGIVVSKDLLHLVGRDGAGATLAQFVRTVPIIPATKKVDDLLQEFRREAAHFAVVLDEHGGVDGIITIEDLLEEIVGEIFDEYDLPSAEVAVRRTKGGDLLINGGISIEDLENQHGLSIPRGDYDTFAGFVVQAFGRIPLVGELLDHGSVRIRVEEATPQRVTLLRILGSRQRGLRRAGVPRTGQEKALKSTSSDSQSTDNLLPQKVGISR
jgi:putative hemolysin